MAKKISINSKSKAEQDAIAENLMGATLDLCKMSRLAGYKIINALTAVMGYVIYETASEKDDELFNSMITKIGDKLHESVKTLKELDEEGKL